MYNDYMPTVKSTTVDVHIFCRTASQPLYLLLHRSPDKRYAGLWRMVAGKIEPDETAVRAAIRELYEETGLRAINLFALDYTHSFYDPQDDCVYLIPVFSAEVASMDVALSDEHDDSRWITYDQALGLLRWPGQREGLRHTHEDVVTPPDRGNAFRVTAHG